MPKVLFINHKFIQCGVYQFGKRIYELISKSDKLDSYYYIPENLHQYNLIMSRIKPDYVVYNWHPDRQPWLKASDIEVFTLWITFYIRCF